MAISNENVLFVYNLDDSDSISLANYYKDVRRLNSLQLLGLSGVDSSEILSNYSDFDSQIETPIKNYINNTLSPLNYKIYAIIIGYNLPSGFQDGLDHISITSRLSRIWFDYSKKENNPLYNRKIYKQYDEEDSLYALIVSKIDAPSYSIAKNMIDTSTALINQKTINGYIYFNPYIGRELSSFSDYQQKMFNTKEYIIPYLGLNVKNIISPANNAIHIQYQYLDGDDSIFWSGGASLGSNNIFITSKTNRYFFYNADTQSALNLRNTNSLNWVRLALSAGYASASGSLSNPDDGFLNPEMFFFTLYNLGSLGEATIFSTPYLNWSICNFGDILISSIPKLNPNYYEKIYDEMYTWRLINKNISSVIAYNILNQNYSNQISSLIVSNDAIKVPSPDYINDFTLLNDTLQEDYDNSIIRTNDSRNKIFYKTIGDLFTFASTRFINQDSTITDINTFLTNTDNKVSRLLLDIAATTEDEGETYTYLGTTIESSNIYPISEDKTKGYWDLTFAFKEEMDDVYDYNFTIKVYSDSSYSTNILNIFSETSPESDSNGWFYDTYTCGTINRLERFPSSGISWNDSGVNVKYISESSNFLNRQQVYYFKVIPRWTKNNVSYEGNTMYFTQIIYS